MSESIRPRLSCPACDKVYTWKKEYAGRTAKCKGCSNRIQLPNDANGQIELVNSRSVSPSQTSTSQYNLSCVACGTSLPQDSVLCVECGTNQTTGKKLKTKRKIYFHPEMELYTLELGFPFPNKDKATVKSLKILFRTKFSAIPEFVGISCALPITTILLMNEIINDKGRLDGYPYLVRMLPFLIIGMIGIGIYYFARTFTTKYFPPQNKSISLSEIRQKKQINFQLGIILKLILFPSLLLLSLFTFGIPILFAYLFLRTFPRFIDQEKITYRNGTNFYWKDLEKIHLSGMVYLGQPSLSGVLTFSEYNPKYPPIRLFPTLFFPPITLAVIFIYLFRKYISKSKKFDRRKLFMTYPFRNSDEIAFYLFSLFGADKEQSGSNTYQSIYDYD